MGMWKLFLKIEKKEKCKETTWSKVAMRLDMCMYGTGME